ncbi:hypothetical protein [Lysobacter sp. CA199]|uniref:hypothetical protein n=1 Tax=Lysobacter sp. CA199 TaxID=3455608 RepID=UPI003F8D6C08
MNSTAIGFFVVGSLFIAGVVCVAIFAICDWRMCRSIARIPVRYSEPVAGNPRPATYERAAVADTGAGPSDPVFASGSWPHTQSAAWWPVYADHSVEPCCVASDSSNCRASEPPPCPEIGS